MTVFSTVISYYMGPKVKKKKKKIEIFGCCRMVVELNLNDSFRCFLYFIFYLATYYKNIGHIIKHIVE